MSTAYEREKEELKHVKDWKYLIKNWDFVLKNQRLVIIKSIRLGVPDKYRPKIWSLLTNAENTKNKAGFTYESLDKVHSLGSRIISADVPRTFPSWQETTPEENLQKLSRILNAYANVDTELVYTQGMNFIAAMFLVYQSEEDAFWSFYSLLNQSSLPHRLFFLDGFPKLKVLRLVVDRLIKERFPEVAESLELRSLDCTIFIPQWLMVCFLSGGFDFDLSSFIFEQFLAFGVPPLISFGLAIIDIHRDLIRKNGFEYLLSMMCNPGKSPEMESKTHVNAAWAKHWITNKQYDSLYNDAKIEIEAREKAEAEQKIKSQEEEKNEKEKNDNDNENDPKEEEEKGNPNEE